MKTISSVMKVQLFDDDNLLVANANTLSSSVVSFAGEKLEVTGGQGNRVLNTYYHSGKVSVTATDTAFKIEYIAMKTGGRVEYGADIFAYESVKLDKDGKGVIEGTPVLFNNELCAWVSREKDIESMPIKVLIDESTKQFTFPNGKENEVVCVMYLNYDESAKKVKVPTTFMPATLHFVGSVQVFEDGVYVEDAIFDIPKYQLTSNLEISMEANGVSSTDISGEAIAVQESACNGGNSYYCTVIEKEFDKDWKADVTSIEATPNEIELPTGETDVVKAVALFNSLTENKELTAKDLVFDIPVAQQTIATVTTDGLVTAVSDGNAELTVSLIGRPEIVTKITITVTP